MAYCTQAQMVDWFGQQELIELTDRSNTGAIDSTVLNAALDAATREIDQAVHRLGAATPVDTTTHPEVADLCGDIARWRLYDDAAPEHVTARYNRALERLEWLARDTGAATMVAYSTPEAAYDLNGYS